jgi:hypothetical protein
MNKHAQVTERMARHTDAVEKAHGYLETGAYAQWRGFRPLFGGSRGRLPHPDWVANVFLRRRVAALTYCERLLETLAWKEKDRRLSQRRRERK